jgi:hypothetical protein
MPETYVNVYGGKTVLYLDFSSGNMIIIAYQINQTVHFQILP